MAQISDMRIERDPGEIFTTGDWPHEVDLVFGACESASAPAVASVNMLHIEELI